MHLVWGNVIQYTAQYKKCFGICIMTGSIIRLGLSIPVSDIKEATYSLNI